jgi:hypothetical protein
LTPYIHLFVSKLQRTWPRFHWHDFLGFVFHRYVLQHHFGTLGINPLNAQWSPICHLLALLGAHHIFRVRRIRVKLCGSCYSSTVTPMCLNHATGTCQKRMGRKDKNGIWDTHSVFLTYSHWSIQFSKAVWKLENKNTDETYTNIKKHHPPINYLVSIWTRFIAVMLKCPSMVRIIPLSLSARTHIQDVPGGMCQTSGECSLC